MHKLFLFLLLALASMHSYAQIEQLKHDDKKENKKDHPNKNVQIPTPPTQPNYRLIDIPLVNYVLISEQDWQALQQYFNAFEQYATVADQELAKMKKLKNPKKRPSLPRLNLDSVATGDLPSILRGSKDKYLSISANDRKNLEAQLAEIKEYIRETQQLFNA